jgi:tRNA U34 5-methylaminomethyl-2-thiouridine-forming methyltransferase MnmC
VRDTVNSRPPAELPLLVANLDSFAAIVDPENWERSLQMLLAGIDAQKGVGGTPRS